MNFKSCKQWNYFQEAIKNKNKIDIHFFAQKDLKYFKLEIL